MLNRNYAAPGFARTHGIMQLGVHRGGIGNP
jgi:hypothetical protein